MPEVRAHLDFGRPVAIGLLEAEKGLTRRSDELARRRRELPWVRVEKDYRFATEDGDALLRDLFGGRSQLLVYHFMFDPDSPGGGRAGRRIVCGTRRWRGGMRWWMAIAAGRVGRWLTGGGRCTGSPCS